MKFGLLVCSITRIVLFYFCLKWPEATRCVIYLEGIAWAIHSFIPTENAVLNILTINLVMTMLLYFDSTPNLILINLLTVFAFQVSIPFTYNQETDVAHNHPNLLRVQVFFITNLFFMIFAIIISFAINTLSRVEKLI